MPGMSLVSLANCLIQSRQHEKTWYGDKTLSTQKERFWEVLEITTFDVSSADGSSDVSRHTLYSGSLNLSPCGLILLISGVFLLKCHIYEKYMVDLRLNLVCEGLKGIWPVINWWPF